MIKSFVIRKPNDELSERLADECITSANQFGISPQKVDGVYQDHDQILSSRNISAFHKMKESKKENPGIKGCFLSHYLLWEHCVKINEPIIIFEHDALMIRPLPDSVQEKFSHILILDHASRDPDYENIIKVKKEIEIKTYEKLTATKLSIRFLNRTHIRGSHAHMVKPLGARTLIASCKTNGYLPLDMTVNRFYTTFSIIEPLIARINPFFSGGNHKEFSHTK